MSSRSRAAANLAWHLSDTAGIDVNVDWDNPSGRPGGGTWRAVWVDGPTVATMRTLAAHNASHARPLDVATLRYSRRYTPTAWAAALIAMAERGDLPGNDTEAIALIEYDLHDTDASAWTPHWPAAAELARLGEQHPLLIAETLIAYNVTKPRHETRPRHCAHCANTLPEPARPGRTRRWCSPACRQAGHRQDNTVTKPHYETFCNACGEPLTSTVGHGRPRRWCSPACRTQAWRTRKGTH